MGRGEWGEGFSGATVKDTWTKPRWRQGMEVGLPGVEWRGGEKMQATVTEQQLKEMFS